MNADPGAPRSSKLAIASWCFYDWANSPFTAVVTSFIIAAWFAGAVAADPVSGQSQWAFMQGAAALAIALTAPFMGAIADNAGKRKPWVFWLTLLMSLGCAAIWFAEPRADVTGQDWPRLLAESILLGVTVTGDLFNTDGGVFSVFRAGDVVIVLLAVAVATLGSELAIVFYNAMLPGLVSRRYIGRVSGWAWGLGYFGGLTALLLLLFGFIQADPPPLGLEKASHEHIRISGPVVALWTMVFLLPLLLWTPDRTAPGQPLGRAIRLGVRQLRDTIVEVRRYRVVWRFLLARLLYIDGINTIFVLGGVFAATAHGMSVEEVLMLGIALNVTAGIGALGFAWLDDAIGAKPTILIGVAGIFLLGLPLVILESTLAFWLLASAFGLFFGPVQAASRSMMARLAPKGMEAEMFGLYAFSGKATAFVGPWLVGIVTAATDSLRLGIATALPFVLVGGLLLWLWVDPAEAETQIATGGG